MLRHGGDLHNLDKNASKPLNFRKYFEERRDEIMQAVQDTLEYRYVDNLWLLPLPGMTRVSTAYTCVFYSFFRSSTPSSDIQPRLRYAISRFFTRCGVSIKFFVSLPTMICIPSNFLCCVVKYVPGNCQGYWKDVPRKVLDRPPYTISALLHQGCSRNNFIVCQKYVVYEVPDTWSSDPM